MNTVLVFMVYFLCLTRFSSTRDIHWPSIQQEPTSMLLSEVNRRGITITSARFHHATDPLPRWVNAMISRKLRNENDETNIFMGRLDPSANQSCFIEFYGVIPKTGLDQGIGYLNTSKSSIYDSVTATRYWFCLYAHSWIRREGLVGYDTMRPLFVLCAPNSTEQTHIQTECKNMYLESARRLLLTLNVELTNAKEVKIMSSSFVLSSPKELEKSKQQNHELGVVAIAPYLDFNEASGILISNWIYHHTSFGFRVFFYDRNGTYTKYIQSSIRHFSQQYINGSVEAIEARIKHLQSLFSPRSYTIRELLGYRDTSQRHARTDQDKSITYSHCRFEHQLRPNERSSLYGGVKSLLVIDFDEFVYCPNARTNTESQQNAILHIVNETKQEHRADEIIFGRVAVNNVTNLDECLPKSYRNGKSVFDCYGDWSTGARHSTFKCMHHSFTCPSTDFHFACTGVCLCKRKHQGNCQLFHLRPLYSGRGGRQNEISHHDDGKHNGETSNQVDDSAIRKPFNSSHRIELHDRERKRERIAGSGIETSWTEHTELETIWLSATIT